MESENRHRSWKHKSSFTAKQEKCGKDQDQLLPKQRMASAVGLKRLRESPASLGILGTPGTWHIRALQ